MKYTWQEFDEDVKKIIEILPKLKKGEIKNVYGIPRGGLVLAVKLSNLLNIPVILDEGQITENTLVVDDICDSGKTLNRFRKEKKGGLFITLFWKRGSITNADFSLREKKKDWIVFPWEAD